MNYLRYLALFFGLAMLAWQGYSSWSLDVKQIEQSAGAGVATKFIQVGDEELKELNQRLSKLKPFPDAVLQDPQPGYFGRKSEVFEPDRE